MFNIKKLISTLLLTGITSTAFAIALGGTAFSITPTTTTTTVQSVGQSAVQYTVTNNATASIPNLSITPSYNSSGVNLTLNNDNCSGETLGTGQSCTFDITIPGSNQPSSFTIRPMVCGFSGHICSQAATTFSVSVVQHTLPLRVYEAIFKIGNEITEQLVGINIADTSDVIRATIQDPTSDDGPLVVSPDGSKVYMTHKNSDNSYSLLVFDVAANSLTQTQTSYSLSYEGQSLSTPGQLAITPNGNTLYITNTGYSGTGYPVYKVDLTDPDNTSAVTGLSDDTTGGVAQNLKGIVISPDGQTVYVANAFSDTNNILSFSTSSSTTSISNIAHQTDLTSIVSLLLSSDGSTLYVAGQSPDGDLPATIKQYNIANSFSTDNTFVPTPAANGNIVGAALSPDNDTLYSTVNNGGTIYLTSINTADMTSNSSSTFPNSVSFFGNYNYVAYAPDGSKVALLNYGSSGNLTALFAPSTPSDVTTVNPSSDGSTVYSRTWGAFIG